MRYGPPRAIALAATFMITFALSVPALARVCHPDPQGTKTILVHGDVVGYTVRGGLVHVAVSGRTACRTLAWNVLAAQRRRVVFAGRGACTNSPLGAAVRVPEIARAVVSVSDGPFQALVSTDSVRIYRNGALVRQFHRVRTAAAQKAILRGTKLLVLVRGSDAADQPDRLEAYDLHGATVRSWALPDQATTLDVAKGIVVFSAAHGGAYALRLRDGMMTLLSPNWYGDVPQIDRLGVVYEDGMFERDRRAHRVPVKFVPLRAVADDFARTYHTFTTSGPITGLAMDGPNVAVSYRGAASESKCDQVLIWDALWHDVAQPTMDGGLSCPQHQR